LVNYYEIVKIPHEKTAKRKIRSHYKIR
jgi:hypothetical protein